MDFWDILSVVAWVVSGAILLWIVLDVIKVGKTHSEEYLLSSREGEDILMEDKRDD